MHRKAERERRERAHREVKLLNEEVREAIRRRGRSCCIVAAAAAIIRSLKSKKRKEKVRRVC